MTKFKVCSKIHLFIIISVIFITIGMAIGTICHFIANGFFNYGGEFAPYKSVTVTYYSSEYKDLDEIKPVCDEALAEFKAVEVSYADTTMGGEIVYKYSPSVDGNKLESAVAQLNAKLNVNLSDLNVASIHEGTIDEGGAKAITFAAIALCAAAAFQFIYFVLRYKLRAAFSALLAVINNVGIFVAFAAITRIPVGAEMIAIGCAVAVITMIMTCALFDRTRKNFANEKYAKIERLEVVDTSAIEVRMLTTVAHIALAVAVVIFGIFAVAGAASAAVLAPYALALMGAVACFYGTVFFTPAIHGGIDGLCEQVKQASKDKKKQKQKKD